MRKKRDNSNQIIKGYEDYIRNDLLDKIRGDSVKELCSETDEV